MAWLLRGEEVLGSLERVEGHIGPWRGLVGRPLEGLVLFRAGWLSHTFGSPARLDIAHCSPEWVVTRVDLDVARRRLVLARPGSRYLVMGESGWAERCHLVAGDQLELKE